MELTQISRTPIREAVRWLPAWHHIPALWDMHTHHEGTGEPSLALFVANGVTGTRDMGSDAPDQTRPRRDLEEHEGRIQVASRVLPCVDSLDGMAGDVCAP